MGVWFEGSSEIACDMGRVRGAFEAPGESFVGLVGLMPGITSVALVEGGGDFVTIRTNEGLMKRTNIDVSSRGDSTLVEFDEEYQAGSGVTVRSHYMHEFNESGEGVRHRMTISDVEAGGLLGFLYRKFGKSNIGNAVLKSYEAYFEAPES